MSHQAPFGHPMHFANGGNPQDYHHGPPQGDFTPPMFPPGIPRPLYMPQYQQPQPRYTQPMSMMPNPYGMLQYAGPVNPTSAANQQVPRPSLGPSPTPALQPQPAPTSKNRPNREVRPGVFAFQIDVLDGKQSETFYADTDMPWVEFRDRVVRILGDPDKVQLSGKIVGEGKWAILSGVEGLGSMMQRLVQKANNARTKAVALEVKNTATPPRSKKLKPKGKRSRKEDKPPATESDDESNAQFMAYKQLSDETRCEAHHGHCHITRQGGSDNHHRLSHQEMTLWAKKMSLNEATKYAAPHCLNFDRGPTLKSGRRTASTSSVPEVHVTIQNIAPDGSSFPSSVGTSAVSSSSPSATLQHHVGAPKSTVHDRSSFPSPAGPSVVAAAPSRPSPPDFAPHTPSISAPFRLTVANTSALSWGAPIPAACGQNIFPPLSSVMTLLASERPGIFWSQLEEFLWEAGVNSSEHILLADPTVLALVGNMGAQQATVLRNYAKRVVLPVLGLQGTYQEDVKVDEARSTEPTRKRPLDLGESVIYGLYKKPRIDDADRTPTPPPYEDDLDIYLVDEQDPNSKFDNEAAEMEGEEDEEDEEDELYSEDAEGDDDEEEH